LSKGLDLILCLFRIFFYPQFFLKMCTKSIHLFGLFILLNCILNSFIYGQRILEVGPGKTYSNPALAARAAIPGDTILIYPASYSGPFFIENLKGTPAKWIFMRGTDAARVIFSGGSESMHFTDLQYVHLSNFTVTGQTGNGMNMDDGGTFESTAKKVVLENIFFRDMAASGNNDMLKLSGLDSFEILNCHFENGSTGGSGIDMVGCHYGNIRQCRFVKQGSNSIQAKGGSSNLHLEKNFFINGGQRSLNLGGSTGLAFFRPAGANYEARDILVSGNIFEGSVTPIAYVGCRNVQVVNNTIYHPERWIMRILQESADTSFFQSCAYNVFSNNIVVVNNSLSTDVNIGPNTLPSSFKFANNLWYNDANASWRGPQLPVVESMGLVQRNPLFVQDGGINYGIGTSSPAFKAGLKQAIVFNDYRSRPYRNPPSIGAMEVPVQTFTKEIISDNQPTFIYPNPFQEEIYFSENMNGKTIYLFHASGMQVWKMESVNSGEKVSLKFLPEGIYFLKIEGEEGVFKLVKLN